MENVIRFHFEGMPSQGRGHRLESYRARHFFPIAYPGPFKQSFW